MLSRFGVRAYANPLERSAVPCFYPYAAGRSASGPAVHAGDARAFEVSHDGHWRDLRPASRPHRPLVRGRRGRPALGRRRHPRGATRRGYSGRGRTPHPRRRRVQRPPSALHHEPSGRPADPSFYLPTDTPCLETLHIGVMDNNLGAVAPSRIGLVPHPELFRVMDARPNVLALIWRETLIQASTFREWLMRNSQKLAHVQTAHFFCEIMTRARAAGSRTTMPAICRSRRTTWATRSACRS